MKHKWVEWVGGKVSLLANCLAFSDHSIAERKKKEQFDVQEPSLERVIVTTTELIRL